MLNQIVMSGTVRPNVRDQTADNIELMITRKQQRFLLDDLLLTIRQQLLLLFDFQADELLQNVHHAVFAEHILPKIRGRVAVRIDRIALAAVYACAVAALIERQEIGIFPASLVVMQTSS